MRVVKRSAVGGGQGARCLTAAAVALACAAMLHAQPAARLSPANFNPRADGMGFNWDLQPGGFVNQGTNYAFSNAMILQVNGNQFGGSNAQQTADGELVLSDNVAGVEVTRRVRVDAKNGYCRWIDSFTNSGNSPQSVQVVHMTQLNNQAQMVITDGGTPMPASLGKDDGGMLVFQQPQMNRPSVLFGLASPRSKHKPVVQIQNNFRFQVQWSVQVPPGRTVSLVTALAQRNLPAPPGDDKARQELFKPFRDRGFLRDVPATVRRSILNWDAGGYVMGEAPVIQTLAMDLNVEPEAHDLLIVGEGTKLRGTAACESLSIDTAYGRQSFDLAQVAATVGARYRGHAMQLYLRDGQVLTGEIETTGLRFDMASGMHVELTPQRLDRLVLRQSGAAGTTALETRIVAMLDTFDGQRLALTRERPVELTAITPWGVRPLRLDELLWLRAGGQERPGYQFALIDGSRFFGMLDGAAIEVQTDLFGPQQFEAAQIRFLSTALHVNPDTEDADAMLTRPHLMLSGGQVIVGRIDLPQLELTTLSGSIPVPPRQVRIFRNVSEEMQAFPGSQGVVLTGELWDGGTLTGRLSSDTLPVRSGGTLWQVPARDVVEVHVPTPEVPPAMRAKIVGLIRDLGDQDWKKREAASRELAAMGEMAAASLREAVDTTHDAEVRRRAQAILDTLR